MPQLALSQHTLANRETTCARREEGSGTKLASFLEREDIEIYMMSMDSKVVAHVQHLLEEENRDIYQEVEWQQQ